MKSLLSQDLDKEVFKMILVNDDGSTNGGEEFCDDIAARDGIITRGGIESKIT